GNDQGLRRKDSVWRRAKYSAVALRLGIVLLAVDYPTARREERDHRIAARVVLLALSLRMHRCRPLVSLTVPRQPQVAIVTAYDTSDAVEPVDGQGCELAASSKHLCQPKPLLPVVVLVL